MLKKEIKYLVKNPFFYVGLVIVTYIIISNVAPYLDLYKNVSNAEQKKYGDMGIIDGYIPTTKDEQNEQVINRVYESLIEDYNISPEEAQDVLKKLKKSGNQKEIEKYLSINYNMRGVKNLYEEFGSKKATRDEMEKYLKKIFTQESYSKSVSYKFIDYLGIGIIYFSIIVFLFVFIRDMKKDMYNLVHTKPISASSYIITKLLSGLLPIYLFAVVVTLFFDTIVNITAKYNGFSCEWGSVWIKLILLIFPNVFMIGVFFIFITMIFKNILPTIPALLVYATYSNMGKVLEDGYSYKPNPLAIVVRFPNGLTENYLPFWVVINQISLFVLAIVLLFISINLWKKKKTL